MARENPSTLILGDSRSRAKEKCSISLAKIKSKPSGGSALEPTKKQSQEQNSPSLRRWGSSSGKPGRQNCLCSPTTHAGSFRCRHHRANTLTRVVSIGSNLSVILSSKSSQFSDSLKAQ
ncbi:unnamed protein product [Eruca vesicaria subsp. sativa]|uniref:Serine-rich protein-like protein n=1 Tax=Eruca vesicaria subsp. sativa TaxID=29727 RepID=A0ABC8M7A0_ERUVS|nr:unnamed protein product [Eruca vesicaria subsp. sativa]